jgi:hypothetical protein
MKPLPGLKPGVSALRQALVSLLLPTKHKSARHVQRTHFGFRPDQSHAKSPGLRADELLSALRAAIPPQA